MARYDEQLKATRAAVVLIPRLPLDCTWVLNISDEDGENVLNITIERKYWKSLAEELGLPGRPTDKGYGFVTYLHKALQVSFQDEEAT